MQCWRRSLLDDEKNVLALSSKDADLLGIPIRITVDAVQLTASWNTDAPRYEDETDPVEESKALALKTIQEEENKCRKEQKKHIRNLF